MRFAILMSALMLAATASARAGLINGDFETGDLTGWTSFNTTHGGTALSDVVLFDTVAGTPSLAAQFRVGETSGTIGAGGLGEGAGIQQSVNLNSGTLNIFLDVATSSDAVDGDGGTFELLLNGTVVAADAFGIASPGTERATLSFSGPVSAGPNLIGIDIRRGYGIGVSDTPIQYLDNVQLSGSAVPEPSAAALTLAGAAIALGLRRRRATAQ